MQDWAVVAIASIVALSTLGGVLLGRFLIKTIKKEA